MTQLIIAGTVRGEQTAKELRVSGYHAIPLDGPPYTYRMFRTRVKKNE